MINAEHHVLYVPGIGDDRSYGQDIAIRQFAWYGITPHYVPLGWARAEGYSVKLLRLLNSIDRLLTQGNSVSLIGVSAGASAVLNAFALRLDSINAVISVCGKINHPENIHMQTFVQNPDFEESMSILAGSLAKIIPSKRQRILSIHPWRDQVVAIEDTFVKDARNKAVPAWSHSSGICMAVTVGVPGIARFIKSRA